MQSSWDFHQKYISNACRVCGFYRGEKRKEQFHKLSDSTVSCLVSSVFEVNVSDDNQNVHPTHLCNNCYAICLNTQKDPFYKTVREVVSWNEHENGDCSVCKNYAKKLRGGRKRKLSKGRGRPKESKSLTGAKSVADKQGSFSLPPNIIPPPIVEKMPELSRFHSPPEDLRCPICKEVLSRPVQSNCQHLFCFECLQEWLYHAGNQANCPSCLQTLVSTDFSQVPRVIMNVLTSLLVSCRSCKNLIQLEQLAHHEQQCQIYEPNIQSKTLAEVLKSPNDAPLSVEEERVITHLVKRKLGGSSKPHVVLKTGGTVSVSIINNLSKKRLGREMLGDMFSPAVSC